MISTAAEVGVAILFLALLTFQETLRFGPAEGEPDRALARSRLEPAVVILGVLFFVVIGNRVIALAS